MELRDKQHFELSAISGDETFRLQDFKGTPLVLTFWVSWCPDCERDLKIKHELAQKIPGDELQFVMIHVTGRDTSAEAGKAFMQENGYSFLSLSDRGTQVYDAWHCMTAPTTFIMDADLTVLGRLNDKSSFEDLMAAIGKAIQ